MPQIINEVNLPNLKINKLSQEAYANLYNSDALKEDEIYLVNGGDGLCVTSDILMSLSINENGGLRITYDDGSEA